jgi:serine/threonine-protein kinase
MSQINQALAKVHQYGWRYLDLKPSNLLLDQSLQTIKLADFGTNRPLRDLNPHSYSGTASWQAPEQFFPVQQASAQETSDAAYATGARSDYFSLGALFYYLSTGGATLRFCSDCGEAYRSYRSAGAAWLRERHGGDIPATLHENEELLFIGRIREQWQAAHGPAASPAVAAKAADNALRLLRQLLAPQPQRRPGSALDISRMLAEVANPPAASSPSRIKNDWRGSGASRRRIQQGQAAPSMPPQWSWLT